MNAFAAGDYAKAERFVRAIERIEGESERVLRNLALARLAQGDYAEAMRYLAKEIDRYGATPHRLRAAADAAYLSRERVQARERIAAALAEPAFANDALLQKRLRICEDVRAYEKAMEGKKAYALARERLAAHDYAGARTHFERAVAADPTDFVALNDLGSLFANHFQDLGAAKKAFKAALALSDQPMVRRNLAAVGNAR